MIKNTLITAIFVFAAITFFGCESKTEKSDEPGDGVNTDGITADTRMDEETAVEAITIPDLKGTWTGTFDGRAATLDMTEQTDSSFAGKMTIMYREKINQEVSGSFSPSNFQINMTDKLHSRYMGKYSGELSETMESFSGTFTMNADGSKFSFNFKKK